MEDCEICKFKQTFIASYVYNMSRLLIGETSRHLVLLERDRARRIKRKETYLENRLKQPNTKYVYVSKEE